MSLHAPAADFDAEDGFLAALLGVLAADAAMRALVQTLPPAGSDAVDDPVLDAILGVIRLISLGREAMSSWAVPPVELEAAPGARAIEGLLR